MKKFVTNHCIHDIYNNKVSVLEDNSRASKPNMKTYISRSIRRKKQRRNRAFYAKYREAYDKAREKEVTEIRYYMYAETGYCVCPGCKCTVEREYQAYCDGCGQKLAWNLFNQNKVTLIKRIPCTLKKKEAENLVIKKREAIVL